MVGQDRATMTDRARCVSIFENLLLHLGERPSPERIHLFYGELMDTARCDAHMPAFRPVRETVVGGLARYDDTLPARVTTGNVRPSDKDALYQNYFHYTYWLTERATAQLGIVHRVLRSIRHM